MKANRALAGKIQPLAFRTMQLYDRREIEVMLREMVKHFEA